MTDQASADAVSQEESVQQLYQDIKQFTAELAQKGWISTDGQSDTELQSAADLFDPSLTNRPLVVGLFGGTGVGKSTLLNRLAGQQIAKTGVVRPTSMEITAYLHQARSIFSLPTGFPQQNFASVGHNNPRFEDVMWVDMPDFDSEETQNRDQVLQWLPYIDLLIYVVTPERYRDAEGWRLLQSHGYRHGWLFVMNQWDKGEPAQLEDFRQLLQETGFNNPAIFTTVCAQNAGVDDDFNELSSLVTDLTERNLVAQLEQHGWLKRLGAEAKELQRQQIVLAESQTEPVASFDSYWQRITDDIRLNLSIPLQEYSARFQPAQQSGVKGALRSLSGPGVSDAERAGQAAVIRDAESLWGRWSAERLYDAIRQFELAQSEHGIPRSRFNNMQAGTVEDSFNDLAADWQSVVSVAAANPGTALHRRFVDVCGYLQWLLPLAVAIWIAYRVLAGFINGAADRTAYVGMDFMVNGLLLGFMAWLIPFCLGHFLRPSKPKAVSRALSQALEDELQDSVREYRQQLPEITGERVELRARAAQLMNRIQKVTARASVLENKTLDDLVMSAFTK